MKFLIPTKKLYKITQSFGANFKKENGNWMYNPYHHGTDLRTRTPEYITGEGLPIVSAQGGKVITAKNSTTYGLYVIIEHVGDYKGFYTLYAHLSRIDVKEGDTVSPGWEIGLSGNTGQSTGAHLHFELRYGKNDVKHTVDPFNPKNEKNLVEAPEYEMVETLLDDWEDVAKNYALGNGLLNDWSNPHAPISQIRAAAMLERFETYFRKKYNIY